MKGLKVKVNMDLVNTVLLVIILALVVYCLVKQNERFASNEGNSIGNNVVALHQKLHNKMATTSASNNEVENTSGNNAEKGGGN